MAISIANEANVYDLRGLSTDEKPLEKVGNGSTYFEIDTEKVFMFDAQNKVWYELD